MCLAQYSALVHNIAKIAPGRTEVARSYLKLIETQIINYSLRSLYTLRYKSEGCGFDFRWSHWNFSLT